MRPLSRPQSHAVRDWLLTLLVVALLLAGALAQATDVVVPLVKDGAGHEVAATVTVSLITEDGEPAIGFDGAALTTEYQSVPLAGAALTLHLTPQSAIALPDTAPTWYQVAVRTQRRTETYRVQVPVSSSPIALRDLVTAAAVSPADLRTWRTLPDPAAASPGWGLVLNGSKLPIWSATGGGSGCSTLACLLDGPGALGTAGQVPTMASGGTAWAWATPAATATWGGITGTLSAQTDLSAALAGLAPTSHTQAWGTITATPTTLAGYGITDAVATSDGRLIDARAPLSHTQAWGTITATPTTLAGYGITDGTLSTDARLSDARAPLAHTQAWSTITTTPTTRAGYGLTDAAASTHASAHALAGADPALLAGTYALTDLGTLGSATLPAAAGTVYAGVIATSGTLTVSPPAAGLRISALYLTGDGVHELAVSGTVKWPGGAPVALLPPVGELWQVLITCAPDWCTLSVRAYY